MYLRQQYLLNKKRYNKDCVYADELGIKSTDLYNAALFRIRQVFTGWDKDIRTENEVSVFAEIAVMKKAYPSQCVRRILSYNALDKIMRANHVDAFFGGLPMQTAQNVLKQAVNDFSSWLKALKEYKKTPSKFTGRPKMPGYKKKGSITTFMISNQDAVLYPSVHKKGQLCHELKLPLRKERIVISHLPKEFKLVNVLFKPFYNSWLLFLDFEVEDVSIDIDRPNFAGIDFGISNAAALVINDQSGFIYKGGSLKSEIRLFCKEMASAVSLLTKGEHTYCSSRHLNYISTKHYNFITDLCHKISRDIINKCLEHNVGILVLGVNRYWKQNSNISKLNNQMFCMMPITKLRHMITYKAQMAGIQVVEQEESYTSQASFADNDFIPAYGINDRDAKFSGKRKGRLYKTSANEVINADMNGAANILRKAIPDSFKKLKDISFLKSPVAVDFKTLNHVKRSNV